MIKWIIACLIVFSINVFSQTYHFDYFLSWRMKQPNQEVETFNRLRNSAPNSNYVLHFEKNNAKPAAAILDFDTNKIHNFNVVSQGHEMQFHFIKSEDVKFSYEYPTENIMIEKLADNRYEIKLLKSPESKSARFKFTVEIEKNTAPLGRMLFLDLNQKILDKITEKLIREVGSDRFIIKKITHSSFNGKYETTLVDFKPTDLVLQVPEKK